MQEYLGFSSYQKDCFLIWETIRLSNQVEIFCLANSFPAVEAPASAHKINFAIRDILL